MLGHAQSCSVSARGKDSVLGRARLSQPYRVYAMLNQPPKVTNTFSTAPAYTSQFTQSSVGLKYTLTRSFCQ